MSSLRPGTPVYTLASKKEPTLAICRFHQRYLTGWVHSEDIAGTDQKFITQWVLLAYISSWGIYQLAGFQSMPQASIISPGDRALFYRSDINGRAGS